MLFSHVTIASFRAKAHLVFHWCLYNTNNYQTPPASAAKNDGVVNISSFILTGVSCLHWSTLKVSLQASLI